MRKSVRKPRLTRSVGRKRERTMERLENELSELGVNIEAKRMRNLMIEQERVPTVKKIRVGKSASLSAPEIPSRDVQGIPNIKVNSFSVPLFIPRINLFAYTITLCNRDYMYFVAA